MLLQRTSGPNSHDLHSPADTECRKTNPIGSIQQAKLPGISIAAHFGQGMGHLAVALRVDIGATAEGRRQLRSEATTWTTFSEAVSKVLTQTTASV